MRGFWTVLSTYRLTARPAGNRGGLFVRIRVKLAVGTSMEIQLLGGAGTSSISIMINDVLRVGKFPLAFAITMVNVILCSPSSSSSQNRALRLSRLFEKPRPMSFDAVVGDAPAAAGFLFTTYHAALSLAIMYAPVLYLLLAIAEPGRAAWTRSAEPL